MARHESSDEPAEPGMATGTVARRLGVTPTTLRSWDQRYGIRPAARQHGKHRRWSPRDIAMLEDMCRMTTSGVPPAEAARVALSRAGRPTPTPTPSPVPDPEPARSPGSGNGMRLEHVEHRHRGLARAAVRLDSPSIDRLLREAVARYGLVRAWQEAMVPTLHAAGRKWESSGDGYVEVEHLLSWHISTVLRQLSGTGPPPVAGAPPVLLACLPGEQHALPLEALNAHLAQRRVPTRMFGAAVPAGALLAAVRRVGPAAVVLWSQTRATADHPLAAHVARTAFGVQGARTRPLVLLGGHGWAGTPLAAGLVRPHGLVEAGVALLQLYDAMIDTATGDLGGTTERMAGQGE
ncbi:MerR family transcriptional regulator [Streptomyces sp. NPDC047434]|uniref:MerR family transcriptional regulator n=1 Tax=Streptomyces sp. NPDC047434 TaxID=3155143 RepID=UPI0033EC2A11